MINAIICMFMYTETLTVVLHISKMIIIVNRLSINIAFKATNILRLLSSFPYTIVDWKKNAQPRSWDIFHLAGKDEDLGPRYHIASQNSERLLWQGKIGKPGYVSLCNKAQAVRISTDY